MKTTLTCTAAIAATVLVASAFSFVSTGQASQELEQEVACTWFPICKDPDFHQQFEQPTYDTMDFRLNEVELISCTWFPICKDPDLPLTEAVA